MKKRAFLILLTLLLLLTGCVSAGTAPEAPAAPEQTLRIVTDAPQTEPPEAPPPEEAAREAPARETPAEAPEETEVPFTPEEDGEYTAPEEVAAYLRAFGKLPGNFITKKEAQALGWPGGDLWKYADGKSIGGDYFGNYEGLLPKGNYHECDVNYAGGSRGAERLIYGADGSIYYTDDHYKSFTQLY